MADWLQHLLALTLVVACLAWVGWQVVKSLRGRQSKIGSCCATGCTTARDPKPSAERVVFVPVEMLTRRK